MITAITLQNFKGIGAEPMRVPVKPLTILFGANSIGKSTIVQAIHYAREILEREKVDPDRTLGGGSAMDLGGFRALVHNHDLKNEICLRFDLDLSKEELPENSRDPPWFDMEGAYAKDDFKSAWVELKTAWNFATNRPYLLEYKTGVNEEWFARTTAVPMKGVIEIDCNWQHPLLLERFYDGCAPDPLKEEEREFEIHSVLPRWGEVISAEFPLLRPPGGGARAREGDGRWGFTAPFSRFYVGPGQLLHDQLQRFRYIGPLRRTLPRSHRGMRALDESLWADGTAAWDVLANSDDAFVEETRGWLLGEGRLNTGFSLRLNKFRRIPIDSPLFTELADALRNGQISKDAIDRLEKERERYPVETQLVIVDEARDLEVEPLDIGIGISQVIPVVVAALTTEEGILAVEQPELHLHLAVQAALGDLFIETAIGDRHNLVFIETHSEHLILRILRRIRESSAKKNTSTPQVSPDDLSLLFVGNRQTGTNIQALRVDHRGRILDLIPGGFFEEGFAELF
jgi:hypothetical protein